MTTLQARAAEAWAKMVREKTIFDTLAGTEPMPPFAAIDYVQDEAGGDRQIALDALAEAACAWLGSKYPETWSVKEREDGSKYDDISVWLNIAIGCVFHLRSLHFSLAEASLGEIWQRIQETLDSRVGGLGTAHSWDLWRREAEKAIYWLTAHSWDLWRREAEKAIHWLKELASLAGSSIEDQKDRVS